MKKIKIEATIISQDLKVKENVTGTIESGIINYQESNNTYVILDINRNEMIRENDAILLKYVFRENQETIGTILVKELNKELEIIVNTGTIERDDDKYCVSYEVENDSFVYEVKYVEV